MMEPPEAAFDPEFIQALGHPLLYEPDLDPIGELIAGTFGLGGAENSLVTRRRRAVDINGVETE